MANLVGTTMRPDGSKEVTYNGHPLYRYSGDTATGDVNGQGISSFGGHWWTLSPAGSALMGAGNPTTRPGY